MDSAPVDDVAPRLLPAKPVHPLAHLSDRRGAEPIDEPHDPGSYVPARHRLGLDGGGGLVSRRTVFGPGFSRWLGETGPASAGMIPPAATTAITAAAVPTAMTDQHATSRSTNVGIVPLVADVTNYASATASSERATSSRSWTTERSLIHASPAPMVRCARSRFSSIIRSIRSSMVPTQTNLRTW